MEVKDQQGLSCPEPQKFQVDVCTCTDLEACDRTGVDGQTGAFKKGSRLGPAGIGLLFLGLLSLLRKSTPLSLRSLPCTFLTFSRCLVNCLVSIYAAFKAKVCCFSIMELQNQCIFSGAGVKIDSKELPCVAVLS